MGDKTTEELEVEMQAAQNNWYRIANERRAFVEEQISIANREIQTNADIRFSDQLKELQAVVDAAVMAHTQRKAQEARAGVGGVYPIGTKLIEWTTGHSYSREVRWRQTGRKGLYLPVTTDMQFSAVLRHSRPDVGEFVIQLTKTDGTQGLQIVQLGRWDVNFYPEGVSPNVITIDKHKGKEWAEVKLADNEDNGGVDRVWFEAEAEEAFKTSNLALAAFAEPDSIAYNTYKKAFVSAAMDAYSAINL